MNVDEHLIARACAAATGAGVHAVGNAVALYRNSCLLAARARAKGDTARAEREELLAARYAHALTLIGEGAAPREALSRAADLK